jgi:RNA polymerase-binding transcription factor DksA
MLNSVIGRYLTQVCQILQRLEREHADAVAQVGALTAVHAGIVAAAADANADDEHDPEGATIAFEREQVVAHLRAAELRVAEAAAALARLDAGTYGTCERCGSAIGDTRLDARPATRWCVSCAAAGS